MADIDWAQLREKHLGDFSATALPPTLELPALPHAVTLFMQKSNDTGVTLKELAKIIETDSGLTLELLRHVNSSFMGLRQKAGNVQHALALLGVRQSKTFIVTTGMQAAVRSRKSRLINQSCFWNASLQKALFAREVALLLNADTETAFAGALLQDYLLPVTTNELFDDYLHFVDTREQQPSCLGQYEQQKFGWDHALAGAALAHRWHLPDDLVCCILLHHHGLKLLADPQLNRTAVTAVAISALLPDQLRQNYHGLELLVKLDEKWNAFDLDGLATTVDEQHEESGLGVRNDFPLARRCRPVFGDSSVYNDGTLNLVATT
jgi:serine/threonine-protein kinase